jgi:D-alanyl-D-alanine carboxypeptidase
MRGGDRQTFGAALLSLLLPLALGLAACGCGVGQLPDDDDDGTEEPTPPEQVLDEEFELALQEVVESQFAAWRPPGLQVAVQVPDHPVWTRALGVSDLESERTLRVEDGMKVGEAISPLIASTLLQLHYEVDELSLHAIALIWYPLPGDWPMTVNQLLGHISGVDDYRSHPDFDVDAVWDGEGLHQLACDLDLMYGPGADWTSSWSDYVIAGLVIEAVTGNPWRDELQTRLLDPLDMDDTRFPEQGWGEIARGYVGETDVTADNHPSALDAAAGMVSTAADLAVFASALYGGDLLADEAMNDMFGNPFRLDMEHEYGLGTVLYQPETGPGQIGHGGTIDGYSTWVGYRPELDASVAVVANGWPVGWDNDLAFQLTQAVWSVVEDYTEPVGDDDDDDDDDATVDNDPRGQQRLWGLPRYDHIGAAPGPSHDGVHLTGWWDYDNDGETIGHFTVTSADFSSGEAVDPISCQITANGSYGGSEFGYPVNGELSFHFWQLEPCPAWPEAEAWKSLLESELPSLLLVPTSEAPDFWEPSYPGHEQDMGGADTVLQFVDAWLAGPGVELKAVAPFVLLGRMPSLTPAETQVTPYAFFGFYWQGPGDDGVGPGD